MFTFLFIPLHQICKYDQSLPITELYVPTKFDVDIWLPFRVMGVKSKQEGEGGGEENEELCPSQPNT